MTLHKKRSKRNFLLIEVLLSLSLVCLVLMPCIRFYCGVRRSFEDDIVNLQLPAVIDNCFFAVEDSMREQMLNGNFPTSGSGELSCVVYTSRGNEIRVPYVYSMDIRKGVRIEANIVKACFADVVIEIFPNQKYTTSVQRSVCVVI
ncbi:type II secretion system protein [Chlamydia crocodili]|uniref:type II secretion system protein n=1 Tax=Chlamydia TaxID=810 RepID=UPI002FC94DB7